MGCRISPQASGVCVHVLTSSWLRLVNPYLHAQRVQDGWVALEESRLPDELDLSFCKGPAADDQTCYTLQTRTCMRSASRMEGSPMRCRVWPDASEVPEGGAGRRLMSSRRLDLLALASASSITCSTTQMSQALAHWRCSRAGSVNEFLMWVLRALQAGGWTCSPWPVPAPSPAALHS